VIRNYNPKYTSNCALTGNELAISSPRPFYEFPITLNLDANVIERILMGFGISLP
jgi:hypothetical protein